jgi:antitoxin component YwqK of YwqJK toxin-antitoxin module
MVFMVRQVVFLNNILFGALCLIAFSCEEEKERFDVDSDHGKLNKVRGVYFLFDETLNGRIIDYYENGDTASIGEYANGIKNGMTRKWYPGGQMKFEGNYVDSYYQGAVAEWYPNGQPYSLFNYKGGKEIGRQQAWQENGKFIANYEVIGDRKYGLTGVKNCSNDWEE